MELTNEFVIDRGVEETWKILNDLEFIAPCMPGAQLQEIEGDEYRGVVKVKVGPITAQYKGKASFVEQDADSHVAKLKAEGRDPRQGNANALITATMTPAGDSRTTVNISTDLSLSGKIASFGRGAIEDVSKKILGQFSDNLREKLEATGSPGAGDAPVTAAPSGAGSPSTGSPATAVPSTPSSSATSTSAETATAPSSSGTEPSAPVTSEPTSTAGPSTASGGIRKIEGPEAQPVDLLAVTGGSVAKRAIPAAGGLAMVLVVLYWLLGRG